MRSWSRGVQQVTTRETNLAGHDLHVVRRQVYAYGAVPWHLRPHVLHLGFHGPGQPALGLRHGQAAPRLLGLLPGTGVEAPGLSLCGSGVPLAAGLPHWQCLPGLVLGLALALGAPGHGQGLPGAGAGIGASGGAAVPRHGLGQGAPGQGAESPGGEPSISLPREPSYKVNNNTVS